MTEVCASNPTSRTFVVTLPSGKQSHVCITTVDLGGRHRSVSLHRPSNLEVNQTLQEISNHRPLHTY